MISIVPSRLLPKLLTLAAIILFALVGVPHRGFAEDKDPVVLKNQDWNYSGGTASDSSNLRETVVRLHSAWIKRDLRSCRELLRKDVVRVSHSQAEIQSGREAVLASLPREWAAYEPDDHGGSALQFAIKDVQATVRGDTALLRYYVDVSGGKRWDFTDTAAFVQVYSRSTLDGPWLLAFEADAWNLDYDSAADKPGRQNFAYDFAIPVKNLARAIRFYTPLLGEPEARTKEIAVFQIKGSRLFLDATGAGRRAKLRPGLPNGWPIVIPPNFAAAKQDAEAQDVTFDPRAEDFGGWNVLYGYEPGGNLIALGRAAVPADITSNSEPELVIDAPSSKNSVPPALEAAEHRLRTAWLKGSADELADAYSVQGADLEASRIRTHGWSVGATAILKSRERFFSEASAQFRKVHFSGGKVLTVGPWTILTRQRTMIGEAPWNRKEDALSTLVLDEESGNVELSLSVDAPKFSALALDFDYSGTPIEADTWQKSIRAVGALTGGAASYKDSGWHGFWGERAVLGLFKADPDEDHIPRHREASTYLSLWVSSVEQALKFAQDSGATLPRVPAINEEVGIDIEPGYKQVYLTDSEGNGLVLTEYVSQRRR